MNNTNTPDSKLPLSESEQHQLTDLVKEQAQRVMSKIPLLGGVAWLMMQQAGVRHTLLSEMDWRVMPALVLGQAKLYVNDTTPIAYVSWAKLSEQVAQRYREAPHHLTASDWKSGEQIWIIDMVTPFGSAAEVLKELREVIFRGQVIHQLLPQAHGETKTLSWPAIGGVQ